MFNPRALEEADERDRERAAGEDSWAASRYPDCAQGQHPDATTAHHRRHPRVRRVLVPPYDATVTRKPPRCRSDHHRKNAADRAGELGDRRGCRQNYNSLNGYGMEPRTIRGADPRDGLSRRASGAQRPENELGRWDRRELLGRERRHRDVRLHPRARQTRTCWPPSSPQWDV